MPMIPKTKKMKMSSSITCARAVAVSREIHTAARERRAAHLQQERRAFEERRDQRAHAFHPLH